MDGSAFDITEARNFFLETAAAEPLLTLRTENDFVKPILDGTDIIGGTMLEDG